MKKKKELKFSWLRRQVKTKQEKASSNSQSLNVVVTLTTMWDILFRVLFYDKKIQFFWYVFLSLSWKVKKICGKFLS
jgi:hypothetical protein